MLKYYIDKTGKVVKSILFPSSEFVDTEPREGSLNPVTSGGVAGSISQADKFEIFEVQDSGGSSTFPTYAQITAALADGKIPVLKRTNLDNGNTYFYICSLIDETNHAVWFRGLEDNNLLVVDSNNGWAEHGDTAKSGSIALDYGDLTFPIGENTYCMHDGYLYYCSVSGGIAASEPWTPAHWTGANVTSIISNVANNPVKNGGALTSAASIDVPNNAVSTLSTSEANLTLNVNVGANEVPNFAVEITAGAAITLTVTKTVGSTVTTLYASVSGGNTLESGKFYQLTCVGSCWTLAEFTIPTP